MMSLKYDANLIYMLAIASIVCVCCSDAYLGKMRLASFLLLGRLPLTHQSTIKINIEILTLFSARNAEA